MKLCIRYVRLTSQLKLYHLLNIYILRPQICFWLHMSLSEKMRDNKRALMAKVHWRQIYRTLLMSIHYEVFQTKSKCEKNSQ